MNWTAWCVIAVVLLVIVLACLFPHVALVIIGADKIPQGTSVMYQVWSGFIPSITVITVFGTLGGVWRRMNCHVEKCWRIGRYKIDGMCVCHVHHPNPEIRKRGVSHEHIKNIYDHGN